MALVEGAKRWLHRQEHRLHKRLTGETDYMSRLVRLAERRRVGTFLDVGANAGQFATDLMTAGFAGRVISFEPLSTAHAALATRARTRPQWRVADRMALARRAGTGVINISQNSWSSSFLPMNATHVASAPAAAYVGTEAVEMRPLDDALKNLGVPADEVLGLKIDTQGYEVEVLAGAADTLRRTVLVFLELSLIPLYDGAPVIEDVYSLLRGLGFRCAALSHEFSDSETEEMLQVNGTFVRNSAGML